MSKCLEHFLLYYVYKNRTPYLSIGYVPLYMLSVEDGRSIFKLMREETSPGVKKLNVLTVHFLSRLLCGFLLSGASISFISLPSRRMVNVPYVSWIMTEAYFFLFAYAGILLVSVKPRVPFLFQGVSANQLFLFLVVSSRRRRRS